MSIYVDADACPVKSEAERVATRHKTRIFIVSNGGLRPSQNPLVENVIVAQGPDVADMWIADRVGPAMWSSPATSPCRQMRRSRGPCPKHNGEALTQANIGNVLATRDLMADLRSADPFRQGGGKGLPRPIARGFSKLLNANCAPPHAPPLTPDQPKADLCPSTPSSSTSAMSSSAGTPRPLRCRDRPRAPPRLLCRGAAARGTPQGRRGGSLRAVMYALADRYPHWGDEIRMWHDDWDALAAPDISHSVRLLTALNPKARRSLP